MAKFNIEQGADEDIYHYYKRLAKRADKRMRDLEVLAEQEGFKGVTGYSYATAQKDAAKWANKEAEKARFDIKPPKNKISLQSKIRDMKKFLSKPTSTKTGIVDIYERRAAKLHKRYGTNFTWQEMGKFFETGGMDKIASKTSFDSKSIMKAIGKYEIVKDDIINQIKEQADKIEIVEDNIVDKAIANALKGNDVSLKDLFEVVDSKVLDIELPKTQTIRNLRKIANNDLEGYFR